MQAPLQAPIEHRLTVVEFPGHVVNQDKALEALGDIDTDPIQCEYPSQMFSSTQTLAPGQAVVLAVNKHTGKTRVVGGVATMIDFPGMVDFQSTMAGPVPPRFSTHDVRRKAYWFKEGDKEYLRKKNEKRLEMRNSPRIIEFGDVKVPMTPKGDTCTDATLVEMFQTRPVHSKSGIIARAQQLGVDPRPLLLQLPGIAYKFLNGPFRNLWIRFGYDPRELKNRDSARKIQEIDFRLTAEEGKGLGLDDEDTVAPNMPFREAQGVPKVLEVSTEVLEFRVAPNKLVCLYPLGDIRLDRVQDLLDTCTLTRQCHPVTGWYTADVLEEVRSMMKAQVAVWIAQQHGVVKSIPVPIAPPVKKKAKPARKPSKREVARNAFQQLGQAPAPPPLEEGAQQSDDDEFLIYE